MENLFIAQTPSTPEVDFRFDKHALSLRGESYPENAMSFYGVVLDRVKTYLAGCDEVTINLQISLAYCNSSSTKLLFSMLEMFNQAGLRNKVILRWLRDADDDTLYDFGQEIASDYPAISFLDVPIDPA